MNIKTLLDEFAKFIKYDPDQKSFNLLSNDYDLHTAGKRIEQLLSGYDPTGVISAIYARQIFMKASRNYRMNLYNYLTSKTLKEELAVQQRMYDNFNDPEIMEEEKAYLDQMNQILTNATGTQMIGERNLDEE